MDAAIFNKNKNSCAKFCLCVAMKPNMLYAMSKCKSEMFQKEDHVQHVWPTHIFTSGNVCTHVLWD